MTTGDIVIASDVPSGAIRPYNSENPIGKMLNEVVGKGLRTEDVAALKEMVGLYERMEDRAAKQAYIAAMSALQAELPNVLANRIIPNNDGTIRSTFADFRTIMKTVGPFLTKHGFSVSFDIRYEDTRLIAKCRMKHFAGHEDSNEFGVRAGKGPPGSSDAQADGAARSYARRGALCDALNIVIDHDDDARAVGSRITPEQAASLRSRADAVGADHDRLLKFAGAKSYDEIPSTNYAAVDGALRQRERAKGVQPGPDGKAGTIATQVGRAAEKPGPVNNAAPAQTAPAANRRNTRSPDDSLKGNEPSGGTSPVGARITDDDIAHLG